MRDFGGPGHLRGGDGAGSFAAPFSILCTLTLSTAVLAPLATAAALRLNIS